MVAAVAVVEQSREVCHVLVGGGNGGVQTLTDLHQSVEVELVGVPLTVHLLQDVLVVVISENKTNINLTE